MTYISCSNPSFSGQQVIIVR